MYNAPSVSYPVGRCAFQHWFYVFFSVLTSTVLFAWVLNQGVTWSWGAAVGLFTLAVYSGWRTLHQTGMLTWDGHVWCLHDQGTGEEDTLGEVHVMLDVQKALLLRWQPASDTLHAKPRWLWLGAEVIDNHWQDVRRAVYQRTDP